MHSFAVVKVFLPEQFSERICEQSGVVKVLKSSSPDRMVQSTREE